MERTTKAVTVTPALAREFLKKAAAHRRVSQRYVDSYAAQMRAGEWVEEVSTISFSKDGKLLDGQMRLLALIETGLTMELLVTENAEPPIDVLL